MRAVEWWEYKLSPTLAIAYATAFLSRIPISSLWPQLLVMLFALATCAAYASVINDLTDFNDDQASGKVNHLVGKSRSFIIAALTACLLLGIAAAVYWRGEALLVSLYLGAWISFTLYSLPPFRLKTRGVLGLLACASGEHLFPSLLAVTMVSRRVGAFDTIWFTSVATWSLSYGLRSILWHQLNDLPNDEKTDLGTFARRHKTTWVHRFGNFIIFPTEAAAFCVMLWRAGSRLAVALLCFYALFEALRKRLWGVNLVVVVPKARYHILMQEYYQLFFPLALLLSSSSRYLLDTLLIATHLFLFPRRALQALKDLKVFVYALKVIMTRMRGRRLSAPKKL